MGIEVELYHGIIVRVGDREVKTPSFPDWNLSYVEFPPGEMVEYRKALMRAHAQLVRVTDQRIYFEQR